MEIFKTLKQLSFVLFSLLFSFSSPIMCSQEKTFYFCGKSSSPEDVLGIPNSIIRKVPLLQELCLTRAFQTNQSKPAKKDWGTTIRQYDNINSKDNPITVPNEGFNDIKIVVHALTQLSNAESETKYLSDLSYNITGTGTLFFSAFNIYEKPLLCRLSLINFHPIRDFLSSLLSSDDLQIQSNITFPDPTTIVTSAMYSNNKSYIIARNETTLIKNKEVGEIHGATRIDIYDKKNNVSSFFLPDLRFRQNQKNKSALYFLDDKSILFLKNGIFTKVWNGHNNQLNTIACSSIAEFCANPVDVTTLAYTQGTNVYINEEFLIFSIYKTFNQTSSPHIFALNWNKSGSHLLCSASHTWDHRSKPDDHETFVIDYHNFQAERNNNNNAQLSDSKIPLDNHQECISSAQWLPDDRHIIGLSVFSIFIWDAQKATLLYKITPDDFPGLEILEYNKINDHTDGTGRSYFFHTGKIAFSTDKKQCFIEQVQHNRMIKSNHIIKIDLDTRTPQVITLEKFTRGQEDYHVDIKTIFNPDATCLVVLHKNILSSYDTHDGTLHNSITISPEKNILSMEFNDKGTKLFLRHDTGIDVYKMNNNNFADILTSIQKKLIKKINLVKIHTIQKKPSYINTPTTKAEIPQPPNNNQVQIQQPPQRPFPFLIAVSAIIGGFLLWKYLKS